MLHLKFFFCFLFSSKVVRNIILLYFLFSCFFFSSSNIESSLCYFFFPKHKFLKYSCLIVPNYLCECFLKFTCLFSKHGKYGVYVKGVTVIIKN